MLDSRYRMLEQRPAGGERLRAIHGIARFAAIMHAIFPM